MAEIVVFFCVGAALFSFILIARLRRLGSDQIAAEPARLLRLDSDGLAERLSGAISYRTVSHQDRALFKGEEFLGLHDYLEKTFPRAHSELHRERVGEYSLLYKWTGTDLDRDPILLMAHMDVVPVEEETLAKWAHPPFGGRLADGQIWGRGALDDKMGVMGILEALEYLVKAKMRPNRTVYVAFGHDEEIGGEEGAMQIAALLKKRGVRLEFVLDEGGYVADGGPFGVSGPLGLVGIAEKGYLSVELTVEGAGGHSSMPPRRTAIGILSSAIDRLEKHRPSARIDGPVRELLEGLVPALPFWRRIVIANLWLFEPLLKRRLSGSSLTDSLIRTTTAPTIVTGGVKENILPVSARATINFRIRPGDSIAGVLKHVRRTVRDPRVKIAPVESALTFEPSESSSLDSEPYKIICRSIRQTIPDVHILPYLVVGATDSRHFNELAGSVLKFLPVRMASDLMKTVHGVDERLPIDEYRRAVQFYAQVIRNGACRDRPV